MNEGSLIAISSRKIFSSLLTAGFFIGTVYAGLGDKDKAFAWLEKDFQQRSGQLPFIRWWPNFESLRSDSRYDDLVLRMGLQP